MSADMSGWTEHPHKLAVDAKGYVWRWYPAGSLPGVEGDSWSMAPTNPDNSPIPQPATFYAPEGSGCGVG